MKYQEIPQTNLLVSSICLGTAPIGSTINKEDSFRLLDLFIELGGNFLDTSLNYADWQSEIKSISEKTIGEWSKQRKNSGKVIVGTKGACPAPKSGRFFRLTREDIVHDLHSSLRNLQTDCIDLFWLHRDDPAQPVESIIDALHEQVEAGNIRYFACSNWTVSRIAEAERYAARQGKQGFSANQMMWSLAQPNVESLGDPTIVVMDEPTKEYHRSVNMAAVPFSSQAGGFFAGKYRKNEPEVSGKAIGILRDYGNDVNFARLERAQEVASGLNTTSSVVSLAYLLSHPFPVFPIIGSRTPEQLIDSCRAGELRLDPAVTRYVESGQSGEA